MVSRQWSVVSGRGREYAGEFVQFLRVAMGPLSGLEPQFEVSIQLNLLAKAQAECFGQRCEEEGKMLHELINSIHRWKHPATNY